MKILDLDVPGRLWLGTARYSSPMVLADALAVDGIGFVTVSLRRQNPGDRSGDQFWDLVKQAQKPVLPNTAGCHSAEEAINLALMAREIFDTPWIKLEVIGDDYTLAPDPFALVEAASELTKQGFHVLPYCTDDLILGQKLLDAGCPALMPWGAPIGTGGGLANPRALAAYRNKFHNVPCIVDAGIGAPSQACEAMEMGFDAVLLNTAVAKAGDPVLMAKAFSNAIQAGNDAYRAGLMTPSDVAVPSTPVVGMPFWHQEHA